MVYKHMYTIPTYQYTAIITQSSGSLGKKMHYNGPHYMHTTIGHRLL